MCVCVYYNMLYNFYNIQFFLTYINFKKYTFKSVKVSVYTSVLIERFSLTLSHIIDRKNQLFLNISNFKYISL